MIWKITTYPEHIQVEVAESTDGQEKQEKAGATRRNGRPAPAPLGWTLDSRQASQENSAKRCSKLPDEQLLGADGEQRV